MVAQYGLDVVQSYMQHVQDNAEESVRRVITQLQGRRLHAAARQRRADQRRHPRRRGQRAAPRSTSPAPRRSSTNNFNAPTAVCMAAVLYVFRTLVDDEIPLNAGCLKPLKVIIPEGSMLNPRPPASVVAGNVETSTCITNTLYGALGVMASAQCTMNNFTFGNARHQYYETIAGGSGAGLVFDGEGPRDRRLRRHLGRADAHDQLAPHRSRGARVPLPGPARQLRAARRLGRRRALARRRRRRPPGPLPRADDGVDPVERPPRRRLRHRRRRRRPAGRSTGSSAPTAASSALDHIASVEMGAGDVFVIETPGGGGCGRRSARRATRATQGSLRLTSRAPKSATLGACPLRSRSVPVLAAAFAAGVRLSCSLPATPSPPSRR